MAQDLYISPLFQKSRAYVEASGWRWFILSAKYGLVDPNSVLEPYEHSLLYADRTTRERWANNVIDQLRQVLQPESRVILLAGQRYAELLAPALVKLGHDVEEPLKGLPLGARLAFFDRVRLADTPGTSLRTGE